jgi:hypothetical protein
MRVVPSMKARDEPGKAGRIIIQMTATGTSDGIKLRFLMNKGGLD